MVSSVSRSASPCPFFLSDKVTCSNFLLTHMGNKTCASNVTGQLESWRCICVSRSGSEG